MRAMRGAAALLAIALAAPAVSAAQQVPNLTGTWVLQVDKSDFGMIPGPPNRVDVIDHKEPNITINRKVVLETGDQTTTIVYAVDGKPHKNVAGQNEITSTLSWDGQTLVVVSTIETPNGQATLNDRTSLSADGKTMTTTRTLSMGGQEATQTFVFARQ